MGQWCLHHGRKTWWPTDNQGASANFRARRVPGTSPAASTSFFLTGNPLPSGYVKICYWKWPFIVDLPINSMVIFHGYVSLPEGMKQTLQQISRNFNKWHRWIMTSIWKNLPIHLICHAFPNDDTSWQYCCPTTQTEVDGPWRIWDHQSLTNRSTSFRIKIFLCLGMSPGSHPGPTRVPPGAVRWGSSAASRRPPRAPEEPFRSSRSSRIHADVFWCLDGSWWFGVRTIQ